jgi:aerobic-type carbon monoxide dehydrogenase small subunit (CoxS/CutS family)
MIMAALGLLLQCPDPDEDTIIRAMQGNICRCGAYARIISAIRHAAAALRAAPGAAQ